MKNVITHCDKDTAIVTKAFEKKAKIFGTDEYKLWRAYQQEWPNAKMTTKKIARNPQKKTNRNLTFDNMAAYIITVADSEKWLAEFELVKRRSKIQKHPYGFVRDWFVSRFPDYADSYVFEQAKNESAAA